MSVKATTQQLEACARLKVQEPHFFDLLMKRREEHRINMRQQPDEVRTRWAQGRAQETDDLIDLIENATNTLQATPR